MNPVPVLDLEAMRRVDVRTVNPETLVEIGGVTVNTALPREDRLLDYLDQVKNPYCVRHGKTVVKLSYADAGVSMEDRLERYLLSL